MAGHWRSISGQKARQEHSHQRPLSQSISGQKARQDCIAGLWRQKPLSQSISGRRAGRAGHWRQTSAVIAWPDVAEEEYGGFVTNCLDYKSELVLSKADGLMQASITEEP